MIFTIIDVETTGRTNRITEISVFKHNGHEIIDEFTSLVNPEQTIPYHITALTGIDDTLVEDAPSFEDIADTILEITKDAVFVAHNVNFDYNVIRNEFKQIGKDFRRKKLCTVRLSRKLLPGFPSYSLGKLCKSLNIPIEGRHRARGDAAATVILFKKLYNKEDDLKTITYFLNPRSREATLPSHLPSNVFNNIPHKPGIYLFKDKRGKIIYVGKAIDLKKRVLSHFYSKKKKSLDLCRETRHIEFELSGGELIALLMEDASIKKNYPKYNVSSKRNASTFGIIHYKDINGNLRLAYQPLKHTANPLTTFYSVRDCRLFLEELCESFELCPKLCHLQDSSSEFNHYKIKCCDGICKATDSSESYNQKVFKAIKSLTNTDTIVIKQKGRHMEENGFVLLKEGKYQGYGFVDKNEQISHAEALEHFLIPQNNNMDVERILRPFLLKQNAVNVSDTVANET